MHPDTRPARLLVAYYGIIQAAHAVALVWAFAVWLRTGELGFPAPPPSEGWSPQAANFLIGLGAMDAVGAAVALAFVRAFLRRSPSRAWWGTLTAAWSTYAAVVYTLGTVASGAWADQPGPYLLLVALFLPVGVLLVHLFVWGRRGLL